jgi:hypothetical protein
MDDAEFRIMAVSEARRTLTNGDLRSEVAFQNDVNRLLALLEEVWGLSASQPKAPTLKRSK